MTDSRAQDAGLGFKPGEASLQAMNLQTKKGSDCQTDLVALRDFQSILSPFNTNGLLEATMLDLDLPGIQGAESRFFDIHLQLASTKLLSLGA